MAAGAASAQLDDLLAQLEALLLALALQGARNRLVMDLDSIAAIGADHELAIVGVAEIDASDESVERFDPVDATMRNQKIERAVNGRRRLRAHMRVELAEQFVSADGMAALEHEFEDRTAQLRQANALPTAQRLGDIERPANITTAMLSC